MKRLIVTADDFGRALPLNAAVEQAHRHGVLTAASLMVNETATDDAVTRARALPGLAVGLHAVVVDGLPVLPPERIPDLVEADGRLSRKLVALGTRIALHRTVRAQVAAELRAQFERFRQTGLPLSHVDSHHHYHLHPDVFDILLPLAVEYGAVGLRIPWEPPVASWRARRSRPWARLATLFHWRRCRRMARAARKAGLVVNRRMFGIVETGAMDKAALDDFIQALPDGLSEVYGHPAAGRWADHPLPAHYRCEDELTALTDPAIAARLQQCGIALTNFAAEKVRR